MANFKDNVLVALLKRMGGPQYLESDELRRIERPQFVKDGEYLVVRSMSIEEQRHDPGVGSHEGDTVGENRAAKRDAVVESNR